MPRFSPRPTVALLGALALLCLTACGAAQAMRAADVSATATARAAAPGTAVAQATQTARPVALSLQLAERGTVAAGDIQLVVTFTVANRTDAPIHLAGSSCQSGLAQTDGGPYNYASPVEVEVDDAVGHAIWRSWYWIACPSFANQWVDAQTIAAGDMYTITHTYDLATGYVVAGARLQVGTPYMVWDKVVLWHQGTLDQYLQAVNYPEQPGVLSGNDVATEAPFTFQ